MYETKLFSKKHMRQNWGVGTLRLFDTINGFKPYAVDGINKTIAHWAVGGVNNIITDIEGKNVYSCIGFLITNKVRVAIEYGKIYFYKMDESIRYFQYPEKTKCIDDMQEEELNKFYKLCVDDETFPKIERIIRRYIRKEIKKKLNKINGE